MKVDSIINLIGNTPLLKIKDKNIYAKLESFNPLGSVKDRPALNMILDAEKRGLLKPKGVIIEPTSGNTGIALAYIGREKGYKVILTMPDNMSAERIKILKLLGAEIVLTPKAEGMYGAINKAKEIAIDLKNAFIPMQFENRANIESHRQTAIEIIKDLGEIQIDYLVLTFGSGGTIMGLSKYLKAKYANMKVIAIEPEESPLLSKGIAAPHGIQGTGANFIPKLIDKRQIDEIITVSTEEALITSKDLRLNYGVFVGISSGAAMAGCLYVEKTYGAKNIVTLFPDTGERYLSIFDNQ